MELRALLLELALLSELDLGIYAFLMLNFKASLLICFAIFCLYQMRTASAAQRHLLSALSLGVLAALPLLSILTPSLELAVLPKPNAASAATIHGSGLQASVLPSRSNFAYWSILSSGLLTAYFSVTGLLLLTLVRQYIGLRRIVGNSRLLEQGAPFETLQRVIGQVKTTRKVRLLQSDHINTPVTAGILHPVIIIPVGADRWDEQTLVSALIHELAHIKRFDWFTLTIAHVACAFFWWMPMAWMLKRELRVDSEYAADDEVINLGTKPSLYAEQLLNLAEGAKQTNGMMLALASPAEIYQRIRGLLDVRTNREPLRRGATAGLVLFTLISTGAIASIEATTIKRASPVFQDIISSIFITIVPSRNTQSQDVPSFDAREPRHYRALRSKITDDTAIPIIRAPKMEELEVVEDAVTVSRLMAAELGSTFAGVNLELPDIKIAEVRIQGVIPVVTVTPTYPNRARLRGVEGYVNVRFDISPEGIPNNIRVFESKPGRVFERSVLRALRLSRFKPAMLNGLAVRAEGVISRYIFRLNPGKHPALPKSRPPNPRTDDRSKGKIMLAKIDSG